MKRHMRLTTYIILLFTFILMILVGCRGAERPNTDMEQRRDLDERGNVEDDMYIDDNNDRKVTEDEDRKFIERAENISDNIVDLLNVDDATAIITKNNDAIIGVDIGDETEGRLTQEMKSKIENTVRETDNQVENIYITDDSNLFEKIDDIEYGLMRGNHLRTYETDINNIINRIRDER